MNKLITKTAPTVILLVGLIAVLLSGCTITGTETTPTSTSAAAGTTSAATPAGNPAGTIAVYVTDAPPDEEITSVNVTISGLRVHKAEAEQERQQDGSVNATPEQQSGDGGEWIDIPIAGNMTTFDLLQVRDIQAFFGSANVSTGLYTQVRLVVESAQVSTADNVTRDAKVSSGEVKIVRPFDIVEGETTELLLDFDAGQSVHFTGNGKVMIKPIIKLSIDARHGGQSGNTEDNDDQQQGGIGYGFSCDQFQAQNNMTENITIPLGTPLTISLCSNATTGYKWNETANITDTGVLSQTDHEFIEPDTEKGVVGAAGREVYTFQTLAAGTTDIYFEYGQPWDGGEKAAWTLELNVTVE